MSCESIKQVERYGQTVWESEFDAVRRGNCLCHQCAKMNPGELDHCQIAARFYEICKENGNAFILTRCKDWQPQVAK